jgi:hypothetical protein
MLSRCDTSPASRVWILGEISLRTIKCLHSDTHLPCASRAGVENAWIYLLQHSLRPRAVIRRYVCNLISFILSKVVQFIISESNIFKSLSVSIFKTLAKLDFVSLNKCKISIIIHSHNQLTRK